MSLIVGQKYSWCKPKLNWTNYFDFSDNYLSV